MIIVEGPDNAGKSTLIRQLIAMDSSLRLLTRHKAKPELGETIGTSYIRTLIPENEDWLGHANGIVDRLLASEEIYGKLYRGGSRITFLERSVIWNLLRAYRAVIVFCDPGDDAIMATWHDRDQQSAIQKHGGADRVLEPLLIAREYRLSIHSAFDRMGIIRYNYLDPNAETKRKDIVNIHQQEVAWFRG